MVDIAIIGGQNGDEGKGKIVEYLINSAEKKFSNFLTKSVLNYRWQGGANAGHTVAVDGKIFKLHQIPSGIVRKNTYCLLGKGMFLNPRKLLNEIKELEEQGIKVTPDKFGISSKAHMTLDYHINDDQAYFNLEEHSSTGSGIKQTARDKADRIGIRFIEFLDSDLMIKILKERNFLNTEQFVNSYQKEREILYKFLVSEDEIFANCRFDFVIAEGAQGIMLDLDDGQYPGITSSNPGLPTHRPKKILGIFKLYCSSVGIKDRPFVSEMDELQNKLHVPLGEFGTTTKKPRHIGWFDVVAAKYSIDVIQIDYIGGTCLDKLEYLHKIGEKLKICIAYEIGGQNYYKWDVSFDKRNVLWNAKPVFEEFETWDKTYVNGVLNPNAKKYIERLEELLGKKFVLLGIGPKSEELIVDNKFVSELGL